MQHRGDDLSYANATWENTMSPANLPGARARGFWGMTVSASRIAWTRSIATVAWATTLVIDARSLTGLKNLFRYAKKTASEPMVMASRAIKPAPRQSTNATQSATVTSMTGESIALTCRALSAAFTAA